MKNSARKFELASADSLFSTEESRAEERMEKIMHIPLDELYPFRKHPFHVKDDEKMMETVESVRLSGVLLPTIVRPRPEGGYEIVSGHRRCRACELAGLDAVPAIIRNLDDDEATIVMVDTNIQREDILPSERSWAYRMKLEALKHQGARNDLTSAQVGQKSDWAVNKLADEAGSSKSQVQRMIRLTELIPPLLDMVDEKKIAINPAYELSFLQREEQQELLDAIEYAQTAPSLDQAKRLKQLSQAGVLNVEQMRDILSEERKTDLPRLTFRSDTLSKYFPKSYTPQKMEQTILKLLEDWKRRQRAMER